MKPSKDKIEKLHIMFPVNVTEEEIPRYFAAFETKLNEVIRKVNELEEERLLCLSRNDVLWNRVSLMYDFYDKTKNPVHLNTKTGEPESQPEEHKHNFYNDCYVIHGKDEKCVIKEFCDCGEIRDPSPKKECEHQFITDYSVEAHGEECIKCNDVRVVAKKVIYTEEGDAVGEVEVRCSCGSDSSVCHKPTELDEHSGYVRGLRRAYAWVEKAPVPVAMQRELLDKLIREIKNYKNE